MAEKYQTCAKKSTKKFEVSLQSENVRKRHLKAVVTDFV